MPQWRKLHVKAVESLDINDMPDDFHRLLWIMLPLGLDCKGRGLFNPAWIKAKIMPLRTDIDNSMIQDAMAWYESRGMIKVYEVQERLYFYVPTFTKYQGNTNREAPSNYPAPPQDLPENYSGPTRELVASKSSTDADADADADAEGELLPITNQTALDLYIQVTGMVAFPGDQQDYAESICKLVEGIGIHAARDRLESAWNVWINTKGKNGRNYSKINCGWIDWALADEIPKPIEPIPKNVAWEEY